MSARLEPADRSMLGLRGDARGGEDGVGVVDRADDLRRVDRLGAVQGDTEVAVGVEALQVVHVVGDGAQRLGLAQQVKVPRRARAAAAREQGGVGVQHRLVVLVGDRAEHLALAPGGVAQQRERLVGVGGDHDLVEALGVPPASPAAAVDGGDLDVIRPSG